MKIDVKKNPAVWLPAIRSNSGADIFTERLCASLNARGIRAEITWLPRRAEYLPWSVPVPRPPAWANLVHVSTWLNPRFIPRNLPIVATLHHSVHDLACHPYKGWLRAAYHRHWIAPIERRVIQRGQFIVAVSRFAADTAQKMLCDDVPIRVIHNGVDTTFFRPKRHSIVSHQPFRLLYVGRWKPLKGVDLLEQIMHELGDDFVLHYTGGHAAGSRKPTMPPNMIDIGRLSSEELVDAMQRADAFLFPSRSEGFGLVVAEAMACGLPVVATRGSSLPEIVTDGETGMLCPQDDVAAFAQAVRRLAADSAMWQTMSSNAVVRARGMFSEGLTIDAYCEVYRDAIGKFGGGGLMS